ncbi:MAG: NUDIX domain-containing protein [Rhizobiales bacterium]|nr:NUDIX domain-containing protein [Hyphomicrobiales bacterium]
MVSLSSTGNGTSETEASSIVVLRRDAVLMVQRARAPFAGLWSFPGGRAESGEDAEATARRELMEETGLTVGPIVALGDFQPAPERSALRLTVFAARAGESAPKAGDDALRAEFVPYESVLLRPRTAGSAGWIAWALVALAEPPLL